MPKQKPFAFSKTSVAALPAPASGRVWYYDSKSPGLTVCVTAKGNKSFYLYRWANGRPSRVHIGDFPALTVEQTRVIASRLREAIARGEDPQAAKRARRQEANLGDLWTFWQQHTKGRKAPRSIEEDERLWKLHLKQLSARRLSTIRKVDIAALHSRIGEQSGVYAANRALSLIKAMFNKADGVGWSGVNPAKGIQRFPEESRDRFLGPDELPAFLQALADEPNEMFRAFFSLALLTGARRSNLQAMRWDEISFDLKQWRIPATKAGIPVIVPLCANAIEILERLRGTSESEWVFPGRRGGHLTTPTFAWKRLLERAGLEDLRIHDLRRSLGSWQALLGSSLQIIGKSLGHLRQDTTAIYARLTMDPVRESVERAAAKMLEFKKAEQKIEEKPGS